MQVSHVNFSVGDEWCELQAQVTGGGMREPFLLWYRFPRELSSSIAVNYGNPLLVALLLPAMRAGERLSVPAPVSAKLLRSITKIQWIYRAWDRTLEIVAVDAESRIYDPPQGAEGALFFSCGVDSLYSLVKNSIDHPNKEHDVNRLIVVHGADINVGGWKADIYEKMVSNTRLIADHFGQRTLSVSTNVKDLLAACGIPWRIGGGPAMASVGLFLEGICNTVCFAAGSTYDEPRLVGTHPMIDPLWSTEAISFADDGTEATRLEKTRLISQHQIALDILRVCWAKERPEYNCGRCSKCLATMIGLHLSGALERCRTFPPAIDHDQLRNIPILIASEEPYFFEEPLDELEERPGDSDLADALREGLAKSRTYFELLAKAKKKIGKLIPVADPFILVDQDTIREQLGMGRRIIPFLESGGRFYGKPPDGGTAVRELERLRADGAKYIVFWSADFWWLDFYAELNQHLRSNYSCLVEDDSLIVFDLRGPLELLKKAELSQEPELSQEMV